jgi:hypothetical protein
VADALLADRLREAERFRRNHDTSALTEVPQEPVTVRFAGPGDAEAVLHLSELNGRRLPPGATLVAEVGGSVLAARSLKSGAAVAHPFRPTAQLAELLALRSAQLRASGGGRVRHRIGAWLRAIVRPLASDQRP